MTRLSHTHEYKFRVRAVNRQGESDWVVTKEIVAKNPFGKYVCWLDSSGYFVYVK